jgi:hypothetical protein
MDRRGQGGGSWSGAQLDVLVAVRHLPSLVAVVKNSRKEKEKKKDLSESCFRRLVQSGGTLKMLMAIKDGAQVRCVQ